jgi:hypothetical protein
LVPQTSKRLHANANINLTLPSFNPDLQGTVNQIKFKTISKLPHVFFVSSISSMMNHFTNSCLRPGWSNPQALLKKSPVANLLVFFLRLGYLGKHNFLGMTQSAGWRQELRDIPGIRDTGLRSGLASG